MTDFRSPSKNTFSNSEWNDRKLDRSNIGLDSWNVQPVRTVAHEDQMSSPMGKPRSNLSMHPSNVASPTPFPFPKKCVSLDYDYGQGECKVSGVRMIQRVQLSSVPMNPNDRELLVMKPRRVASADHPFDQYCQPPIAASLLPYDQETLDQLLAAKAARKAARQERRRARELAFEWERQNLLAIQLAANRNKRQQAELAAVQSEQNNQSSASPSPRPLFPPQLTVVITPAATTGTATADVLITAPPSQSSSALSSAPSSTNSTPTAAVSPDGIRRRSAAAGSPSSAPTVPALQVKLQQMMMINQQKEQEQQQIAANNLMKEENEKSDKRCLPSNDHDHDRIDDHDSHHLSLRDIIMTAEQEEVMKETDDGEEEEFKEEQEERLKERIEERIVERQEEEREKEAAAEDDEEISLINRQVATDELFADISFHYQQQQLYTAAATATAASSPVPARAGDTSSSSMLIQAAREAHYHALLLRYPTPIKHLRYRDVLYQWRTAQVQVEQISCHSFEGREGIAGIAVYVHLPYLQSIQMRLQPVVMDERKKMRRRIAKSYRGFKKTVQRTMGRFLGRMRMIGGGRKGGEQPKEDDGQEEEDDERRSNNQQQQFILRIEGKRYPPPSISPSTLTAVGEEDSSSVGAEANSNRRLSHRLMTRFNTLRITRTKVDDYLYGYGDSYGYEGSHYLGEIQLMLQRGTIGGGGGGGGQELSHRYNQETGLLVIYLDEMKLANTSTVDDNDDKKKEPATTSNSSHLPSSGNDSRRRKGRDTETIIQHRPSSPSSFIARLSRPSSSPSSSPHAVVTAGKMTKRSQSISNSSTLHSQKTNLTTSPALAKNSVVQSTPDLLQQASSPPLRSLITSPASSRRHMGPRHRRPPSPTSISSSSSTGGDEEIDEQQQQHQQQQLGDHRAVRAGRSEQHVEVGKTIIVHHSVI